MAESLPIVSIGDALPGAQAAGEVVFDNRTGVTLALEHLHKLGHRRIGVLTPTQPSTPDRPADMHVTAEAERLGLDVSIISSPPVLTAATEIAHEVLSKTDRPTALFCFADSIAYGAYAAARELGLSIPGEVSISGYDDHPMSALLTPALTTMDWNIDRIVRDAVRLVLAAIERKPYRRRTVQPPHLVQTRLHRTTRNQPIRKGLGLVGPVRAWPHPRPLRTKAVAWLRSWPLNAAAV